MLYDQNINNVEDTTQMESQTINESGLKTENIKVNSYINIDQNNNERKSLINLRFFKYLTPTEKTKYILYLAISILLLLFFLIYLIYKIKEGAKDMEYLISAIIVPLMLPAFMAFKIRLNGVRKMHESENTFMSLQELKKEERGMEQLHSALFKGNSFSLIIGAVVFIFLFALLLFIWFVMGFGKY